MIKEFVIKELMMAPILRILRFIPLGLALWAAPLSAQEPRLSPALSKIHSDIEQSYPALSHVSAAEMHALLAAKRADILLLDVRKDKEYAVSHIDGAIRVDPDITAAEFMALYGPQAAGKDVVLYCSVGRRSSRLAARLRRDLHASGAQSVSNLEGGIFNWHNKAQPLVSPAGATDHVHPYNRWWGRLVTRKDKIAYKRDEIQLDRQD